MTIENFEKAICSEQTLKKYINSEEFINLTNGKFSNGRVPYVFVFKTESGAEIRMKFVDTVKIIRNSKNQEVPGKESFLSYLDISAHPIGMKGYFFTTNVLQLVWANGKSKAQTMHEEAVCKLKERAAALGIDLSESSSWCKIYTENY